MILFTTQGQKTNQCFPSSDFSCSFFSMIMAKINVMLLLMILLIESYINLSHSLALSSQDEKSGNNYVEEACSVTRYRDICIHSLASFSNVAKNNPSKWARASVSVALSEAKRAAQYLSTALDNKNSTKSVLKGRNRIALSDCVECFGDTLDNLHRSLGVLRRLSVEGFVNEMEDVTTWVSAALTDEDTCLDGFDENRRGKRVRSLMSRVSNVSYMTSNALALINKLATTGPQCLME